MYRHSIFFGTQDEAEKARKFIEEFFGTQIEESFLSNDGESGHIEVRFFTKEKLAEQELRSFFSNPLIKRHETYAFNCDDGQ